MSRRFRKVAVLMGGPSSEREVSLRSGAAVAKGLREAGYDVAEMDIRGHDVEPPAGVEAAFIALHGEFGEDGQVQAILDRRRLPYTGSGPEASRASFDKVETKKIGEKEKQSAGQGESAQKRTLEVSRCRRARET